MKRTALKRKVRVRAVSTRGKTIKKLDALVREIVLKRDGERCRKCGAGARGGRGFALQAAHVYGKGAYPSLRFKLENVLTLCQPCHYWWHAQGFGREACDAPNVVRAWCVVAIGEKAMHALDLMAQTAGRGQKLDLEATRLFLELAKEKHARVL